MKMKTIIALFSGNGTNLQNIIHTYQNKYKIIAITNNKNANGIKICEKYNNRAKGSHSRPI
jgi:folate-dependent phosphoribosylglycinamide formyltransferase PurN